MRHALKALWVLVVTLAPLAAHAQNGTVPDASTDHTANRIDSEVFGWSTDYREMAAVAISTHRNVRGGQRGVVMLVVWDTNSIQPVESIDTNVIQAAELPNAPIPVVEAKEKLFEVDYNIGSQWPMRPKKTRPNGWMTVDTLWDPIKVGPNDCMPAVAFLLSNGDELRFQPHQKVTDVRAPCDQLRMSHVRTYWAKPDLAAVMARFDFSPDDHENSFRQPVSAKWNNARELRFLVRTSDASSPRTLQIVRSIARYGKVKVVNASAVANTSVIVASPKLGILADRFARELGLDVGSGGPEGDIDVVITVGNERLSKR